MRSVHLYGRPEVLHLRALAGGLTLAGYRPVWQRPSVWRAASAYPTADAVVVHGLKGQAAAIAAFYAARGVPVWVLDLPRLREEAGAMGLYRESLHWLPPRGTRPVVAPAARKVAVADGPLVILGQVAGDAAHGMDRTAMDRWLRDTVARCRVAQPARPVVVRPHPRDPSVPGDRYGADAIDTAPTIGEALAGAAAAVTYNSTGGWDAIAAGVPVVALAPEGACAYAPYACALDRLERLPAARRTEALARAAASQWTVPELRDGRALDAMGLAAAVAA